MEELIGVIGIGAISNWLPGISIVVIIGFIGMKIGSLLGATMQQRGRLPNNGVNVVSAISGGVVADAIRMVVARR